MGGTNCLGIGGGPLRIVVVLLAYCFCWPCCLLAISILVCMIVFADDDD